MFKIKLKRINCINGKFVVFLDSDNRYEFDNKRKAKDFLNVISERLTQTLVFINEEYCAANDIYRQYFFILKDFKQRFLIEASLDYVKNKISLLLFRGDSENRNTIVILGVEGMLFELKSVYRQFEDIAISRSDTAIRHKIGTKCRILDLFIADLRRFEIEIEVKKSEIQVFEKIILKKIS